MKEGTAKQDERDANKWLAYMATQSHRSFHSALVGHVIKAKNNSF